LKTGLRVGRGAGRDCIKKSSKAETVSMRWWMHVGGQTCAISLSGKFLEIWLQQSRILVSGN